MFNHNTFRSTNFPIIHSSDSFHTHYTVTYTRHTKVVDTRNITDPHATIAFCRTRIVWYGDAAEATKTIAWLTPTHWEINEAYS